MNYLKSQSMVSDKTFIDDIGLEKDRNLLIESIKIGHRLGLSIVAEESNRGPIYLPFRAQM